MENEIKETSSELQVAEIKKKLTDLMDLSATEELLSNNNKIFEENGVTYRVHKPTFKEKQEIYQKRVEKFTELLNNEKYFLEKDLKKTYLKRDINIDAMTQEMSNKMKRRDEIMLQLGELIKNGAPDDDLLKYKNEIQAINAEIQMISIQKTTLLEFSIENQVMIFIYSYMTFIVSEKKVNDNWVKVWNTFEEFQNDSSNIVNKLSYFATLLGSSSEM
jgi:hypothetical protein